ncbi:MAG: periplasmic heavy metal sensor [Phenylobacterium sp.]|nr:MAG: periplasmic heavy metal sensor [Phenylobacterium sp.]
MSRRTILILLFVSLALNLFVLGAVAGARFFGERGPGHRPEFRGGPPMFAAGAALSDTERSAYQDVLHSAAADAAPKLRQARALRHDAWSRLGTDPVDAAAIAADLDHARALETEARGDVDHKIVDFAAKLPVADRGKLGQALSTPPQRRGGQRQPPPPPAP